MNYTEINNISGFLVMIDFEKAFYPVSWKFIDGTLIYFEFGSSFSQWVAIFQHNTISCVFNQVSCPDTLSSEGDVGKEIQSHLTFFLKGIKINDNEYIMWQYADDTLVIIDNSEMSVKATLKEIEEFNKISGLKINKTTNEIARMGSKHIRRIGFARKENLNGLHNLNY